MVALMEASESFEDLVNLSPEELLLRWVNYHLSRSDRRINNFSGDVKDSEAYILLLNWISRAAADDMVSRLKSVRKPLMLVWSVKGRKFGPHKLKLVQVLPLYYNYHS